MSAVPHFSPMTLQENLRIRSRRVVAREVTIRAVNVSRLERRTPPVVQRPDGVIAIVGGRGTNCFVHGLIADAVDGRSLAIQVGLCSRDRMTCCAHAVPHLAEVIWYREQGTILSSAGAVLQNLSPVLGTARIIGLSLIYAQTALRWEETGSYVGSPHFVGSSPYLYG